MFVTEPLTKSKAERLCKLYFYLGFALLPFMWVLTTLTFKSYRKQSPIIDRYVKLSVVCALTSVLVVALWLVALYLGVSSASALWVIRPGQRGHQSGLFATAVYSAL